MKKNETTRKVLIFIICMIVALIAFRFWVYYGILDKEQKILDSMDIQELLLSGISNHEKDARFVTIDESRTLLVELYYYSDPEQGSDVLQVRKALESGGEILVSLNPEVLEIIMPDLMENANDILAFDVNQKWYVHGAILNYISSKGWIFTMVDRYENGRELYYFTKATYKVKGK